jgi:putative heme iron utilization protein
MSQSPMPDKPDPIRPTDDMARQMARNLMAAADFAALAVLGADGAPAVTRIAFGLGPDGMPVSLVSDIAAHTRALAADPRSSLMVGEPGPKGDPLTHPRLTLQARAQLLPHDTPDREALAQAWLARHPKSQMWIGFADFRFARFAVTSAFLNGGFGKAFRLTPEDLGLPAP